MYLYPQNRIIGWGFLVIGGLLIMWSVKEWNKLRKHKELEKKIIINQYSPLDKFKKYLQAKILQIRYFLREEKHLKDSNIDYWIDTVSKALTIAIAEKEKRIFNTCANIDDRIVVVERIKNDTMSVLPTFNPTDLEGIEKNRSYHPSFQIKF